jgi:tetratricopeptide (TPR) repeat protein
MYRLLIREVLICIVFLMTIFQLIAHAGNLSVDKDITGTNERDIEQRIKDSYLSMDFSTSAKLLEIQTSQMNERVNAPESFKKQLVLAYIYAWKLNKVDSALAIYQKLADQRAKIKELNKFPAVEYLYTGEIYEMKKDFPKAIEYYWKCLDQLKSVQEKESDDLLIMMSDDLTKLIKYRIDSINLKANKEAKLLLEKIKPATNPAYLSVLQMLSLFLVPTAEYDMSIAMKSDLTTYIKQSPYNIASESMNVMLALSASASSIDETSGKAMNAYLAKYPDSYYSLILGAAFYKYYKENGIVDKERALLKELQNIAKKRKMELVLGPDSRFSSPEKTFEIYKKALIEGNLEGIAECYVSGQGVKMKELFSAIGKEKTRDIGSEMGSIQKITGNDQTTKYRILRKENGQDITYFIIFHNIDGEWKMEPF